MSSDVTFRAIAGFRLVTAAPDRLAAFYQAIGFDIGNAQPITAKEMALLGLAGSGTRRLMTLGTSHVDLDMFERPGRAYPTDAKACDIMFQHLALVTDDAESAWFRACEVGAAPIGTRGAVTLPKSAGGVTAVKFRDPDGHPLEFLQFPSSGNSNWPSTGIMGIDHSAIAVTNIAASRHFYAAQGLSEGEYSLNTGPPQSALDGLDDVEVEVLPMKSSKKPPHVELLGYRHPHGAPRRDLAANDIAATRIVWRSHYNALLRDPDGHLHQLMS
jgi:catechol 2,3-dioxygenase-like lactoylglutathione lyase family enzyme